MKTTKKLITFSFWMLLAASAGSLEFRLLVRFPVTFLLGLAGLTATVLCALLAAPEAYEDKRGFHIKPRRLRVGPKSQVRSIFRRVLTAPLPMTHEIV